MPGALTFPHNSIKKGFSKNAGSPILDPPQKQPPMRSELNKRFVQRATIVLVIAKAFQICSLLVGWWLPATMLAKNTMYVQTRNWKATCLRLVSQITFTSSKACVKAGLTPWDCLFDIQAYRLWGTFVRVQLGDNPLVMGLPCSPVTPHNLLC